MRTPLLALVLSSTLAGAAPAADPDAFLHLAPGASTAHVTDALFGATLFRARWDASARPGLGPDFDAASCHACHPRAGRGSDAVARVLRLEPPDPRYGRTLSRRAVSGRTPEAVVDREGPTVLAHGPLPAHTAVSVRIAPQLAGVGLLEAIPAEAILAGADPDDRDGDGISGRASEVGGAIGRFGWRAEMPSIRDQVVRALADDMGVGADEIAPADVDRLVGFVRLLAPPEPTEEIEGARLFARLGCDGCHVPAWTTGTIGDAPELSNQRIAPYTDLLLHDMGPDLADRRIDGHESGREWRTPPLWGIGQIAPSANGDLRLLHDGRAPTVFEAIALHDGEAAESRRAALGLDPAGRSLLERFVHSR